MAHPSLLPVAHYLLPEQVSILLFLLYLFILYACLVICIVYIFVCICLNVFNVDQ
jgi:hypothetical protein